MRTWPAEIAFYFSLSLLILLTYSALEAIVVVSKTSVRSRISRHIHDNVHIVLGQPFSD